MISEAHATPAIETHLTKPEMKAASGTISRPRAFLAQERSKAAMMFAAASHTLASANICPGQILRRSSQRSGIGLNG